MAYGTELFLGFTYPKMLDVFKELGLAFEWEEDEDPKPVIGELGPKKLVKAFDKNLAVVWLDCLNDDLGIEANKADFSVRNGEHKWKGYAIKVGDRQYEAHPWRLGIEFDPHELGDDEKQAIFGISLISRYTPTFLDLDQEHGGSDGMVCLNAETMKKIEFARKRIAAVLPPFEHADLCFKTIHY